MCQMYGLSFTSQTQQQKQIVPLLLCLLLVLQ